MVADGVLKVGDKVTTPDGAGVVTDVRSDTRVGVKLKNDLNAVYTVRDLTINV